jgi:crotonobetainyl-CoA:carnitine CoA-transferase CaiB-like acyl-CoA transferase
MLLDVTELDHLLDRPGITSSLDFQSQPELLDEALVPWLAERTVAGVVELFQAVRIPAAPANTMLDLLDDEHLAQRGYWRQHGSFRVPGPPFRFSHRQAPGGRSWLPAGPAGPHGQGDANRAPLGGLRVLDLTRVWAGPLATRVLADLGADVVCVEAPWARGPRRLPDAAVQAAGYYPDGEQGACQWNRNAHFAKYALGKRSVVLDLEKDAGRATLEAMVGAYDVLIENYSPRVMPQLGLDEDRLHELNPDLLYVTMPGYGRSGPDRNWVAYGTTIDSHAGLSTLIGYPDRFPWKAGIAWPDPLAGLHAACAVLIGLWEREAGEAAGGMTIEVPQLEVAIAAIGDRLLEAQIDGLPTPRGNREPAYLAQGVYRCAGDDRWIALSVTSAAAWNALCELAGLDPGLIRDHDALDLSLTAWTATFDQCRLMATLQQAGIAAGAVLDAAGVLADPHLLARGAFAEVDQPEIGPLVTPVTPVRLSATPAAVRRAAPRLGQDNLEVLRQDAGLDPAAISQLMADGIVADEPPA